MGPIHIRKNAQLSLPEYIQEQYGAAGERLFAKYPSFSVYRHEGSRKWFAVIMEIPRQKLGLTGEGQIRVVNLKCDPRLIGSFREMPGIFPAYHMNKAHWLTVALDGTVAEDALLFLLDMSFQLTKGVLRK